MEGTNKNEPKSGFLSKNLEGHEDEISPDVWSKIEASLKQKKRRRLLIWWIFGLGLMLVGTILLISQFGNLEYHEVSHLSEEIVKPATSKEGSFEPKQPEHQSTTQRNDVENQKKNGKAEEKTVRQAEEKNRPIERSKTVLEAQQNSINHPERTVDKKTKRSRTITSDGFYTRMNDRFRDRIAEEKQQNVIGRNGGEKTTKHEAENSNKRKENQTNWIETENKLVNDQSIFHQNEMIGKRVNQPIQEPDLATNKLIIMPENSEQLNAGSKDSVKTKPTRPNSIDSVIVLVTPDSSDPKPAKKSTVWIGISAGLMRQSATIFPGTSAFYSPQNMETNYRVKPSQLVPAFLISAQANPLWNVGSGLKIGFKLKATGIYQQLEVDLQPGKYSSSRFEYSPDSLTFIGTSNSETGLKTYARMVFLGDFGVQLQYKPDGFPIGVGLNLVAIRYQYSSTGKLPSGNSAIQYFLNSAEIRLFYPMGNGSQLFLEYTSYKWKEYNLPLPVRNGGTNRVFSIGYGWNW